MNKKKTGAYMGGGMAKKKGSMYNKGGMPMVMKAGKKVPAFAADGVGKMNMGGMAKKKPMAATGYKEGGTVKKKKETFGQAFKRNRKKFMNSGKANDYTFKYEGKDYNVRQKGETEKGLLAKYVKSAPKTSVRPKARPVATPSATTSKDKGSSYAERQTQLRIQEDKKDKAAAAKRKAIRRSSAASKTLGTDPAPTKKQRVAVTEPYMDIDQKNYKFGDVVLPKDRRKNTKGDAQDNNPNKKTKAANSANVRAGQAKFRDRGAPAQLTLSQRNLRKFKNDPSSLTKIQKDRLFKSLKRQGVAIPKGLSGNNR